MRVGIVGVGIMGGAMATNLARGGHVVTGYDVDSSNTAALADGVLIAADSPGDVATSSDVVILSLPSAAALSDVAVEIAKSGSRNVIVLETGTLALDTKFAARDRLGESGIELMDTPLSGTGLQARDAKLVVYASGSESGYMRCIPVFEAIGRSSFYLGEFGNGTRMKFIANLLVAIHNLATAEAHVLGIASGIDPAVVQRAIEDGVGSSKIFEIRGPMMVADDYPPAARLDIILKDATLITEYARSVGAPTPLLDLALSVYQDAAEAGFGDLDAAALCRHLERVAGLAR